MEHVNVYLPDYVRAALDGADVKMVELHLLECHACREEEQKLRILLGTLASHRTATVPSGYFQTLLPRIRMRLEEQWSSRRITSEVWTKLVMPAGVGLTVLLILMSLSLSDLTIEPNGMKSFARNLEASEVMDALLDQSLQQGWSVSTAHKMEDLVSARSLTRQLVKELDDSEILTDGLNLSNDRMIELNDQEVGILLQRLSERKIL